MGNYKIQLILDGKSNIQGMMNSAGKSVKSGIDTIKQSASGADASLDKLGSSGRASFMEINYGARQAQSGIKNIKGESSGAFSAIKAGATSAGTSLKSGIESGARAGASALKSLGSAGASAIKGIGSGLDSIFSGFSTLEGVIGGVIGGFGLMEIATMSWGGATQREFNTAYLQTVMSDEAAQNYLDTIAQIVSEVPGNDTFMNALLTGALARQSDLTVDQLKMLGDAAAYYTSISQQVMGGFNQEYEREIKDYILTGNTGLMQRDGLLRNQIGILEGKSSVEDRILAINEALTKEGYKQIPLTELASSKAEELKGKFQLAATELGTRFLPHLITIIDFLTEMDTKTGGFSTQLMLAAGAAVSLGGMLGLVYSPLKDALGAAKDLAGWIKDKIPSTKVTTVKCVKDPSCEVGGTGTSGTGGRGKISSIINTLGLTGVMAGTGEAVGITGALGGGLLGFLGGLAQTGTGFGLQSIANWVGKNTPEGQTGLGQFLIGNAANIPGLFGGPLTGAFSSLGGSYAGGTNLYKLSNPFNINLGQTLGQDWSRITDAFGSAGSSAWSQISNFGGMLGNLLPKPASAAGGSGGKPSILQDITGKGGLLDFSRFNIPQLKFPSLADIKNMIMEKLPKMAFKLPSLNDLKNWITSKIPKFNWKIPSIPQIIQQIKTKIAELIWNIPGVPQLLGQTWQKIKDLFWQIPGVGSLLNQTWQKIKELVWQIPSAGEILGKIAEKIGEFVWPMGPSRGVSNAGGGSGGGGGKAFGPPSGIINDHIATTMSNRSGVGRGHIMNALNKRFTGVSAFNDIANGISDHLSYEFYFGGQKSNEQVWQSGTCNCYDGAEFLIAEGGQRFGLSTGMANGMWDGTSIPHTWSTIGGKEFDMAAKLIRGYWNHPAGPEKDFDQFMTDIGPGLEWMAYGGHRIDPYDALGNAGNCFDMTLGVMGIASNLFGLPSKMIWGHYEGNSHVWAQVGNRYYDPTRMALERTYSPPPQGPAPKRIAGKGDTFIIEFSGTVYNREELEQITKQAANKVLDEREKKRGVYDFSY